MKQKQNKAKIYTVYIVCAWCTAPLGTTTSSTPVDGPSHGICPSCDSDMKKQLEERKTTCPAN